MKNKQLWIAALVVAGLLVSGCGREQVSVQVPDESELPTEVVAEAAQTEGQAGSGQAQSADQSSLQAGSQTQQASAAPLQAESQSQQAGAATSAQGASQSQQTSATPSAQGASQSQQTSATPSAQSTSQSQKTSAAASAQGASQSQQTSATPSAQGASQSQQSPAAPSSQAASQTQQQPASVTTGGNRISFGEFFDGDNRTTPSARFWDMKGQQVEIHGYMGEVLSIEKNWFLLIPRPGAECPFDNGDGSLWNEIMIVFVQDGDKLRYTSGPLKITGTLDVGIKVDQSGYRTMFRLQNATFEKI